MKKTLIFILLFSGIQAFAQTNWKIDKSHSDIRFTVTHMAISEVDGEFGDFDASMTSTSDDFAGSRVEFTAKIASIDTDNQRRDDHLKGTDFFDAASFPELKFGGTIVKEEGRYYLVGDLTIRDITKKIRFDVKYNGQTPGNRGKKAGFKVTGTIDRFDYGLMWSRAMESGGLIVSREVSITCNVQMDEAVASN